MYGRPPAPDRRGGRLSGREALNERRRSVQRSTRDYRANAGAGTGSAAVGVRRPARRTVCLGGRGRIGRRSPGDCGGSGAANETELPCAGRAGAGEGTGVGKRAEPLEGEVHLAAPGPNAGPGSGDPDGGRHGDGEPTTRASRACGPVAGEPGGVHRGREPAGGSRGLRGRRREAGDCEAAAGSQAALEPGRQARLRVCGRVAGRLREGCGSRGLRGGGGKPVGGEPAGGTRAVSLPAGIPLRVRGRDPAASRPAGNGSLRGRRREARRWRSGCWEAGCGAGRWPDGERRRGRGLAAVSPRSPQRRAALGWRAAAARTRVGKDS